MYTNKVHSAARSSYDRISRWYDWLSSSERIYIDHCLEMLSIRAGERVLEIGCGTGYALAKMTQTGGKPGNVTGYDLSRGMLQVARQNTKNASLVCGDALQTPFPNSHFDLILLSFTLELFPDVEIPRVLKECKRVLHPGGRLGVVGLSQKPNASIMVRFYKWFHNRLPTLIDCRPIELQTWIEEAGFQMKEKTEWRMWGLDVDGIVAAKKSN